MRARFNPTMLSFLRMKKGVSIRQLARETGLSNPYLSQMENGVADNPSIDVLLKLADYFGVTVETFISGRQRKKKPSPRLDAKDEIALSEFREFLEWRRRTKA